MTSLPRALPLLAAAALLAGCGAPASPPYPSGDQRLSVVATTSIVADLARNIGGEQVRVEGLMGPGVDPHLYRAREGDVRRLQEADLILFNGLHLEAKLAEVLERMPRAVAVTETIPRERLIAPPEFEGAHDPHVWFDVSLWMIAAERTRDALTSADPAGAPAYAANAAAYLAELEKLHRYALARVAETPQAARVVITAHDAFNYFGSAYGLEVRGLQGISTAAETGAADVQALAELVANRRIPAMFVESSVPPRSIEAVQAAVRARGFEVGIGGELYSDALGDPAGDAGTYLGMVRHNVDTIVDALTSAGR